MSRLSGSESAAGIVTSVLAAAEEWLDPDFDGRLEAIAATLALDNTFTPEAVEFAIDQQMSELTHDNVEDWLRGRRTTRPRKVAVLSAGNVPFVELQDCLAVLFSGHTYLGVLSSKSDRLLPAFLETAGVGGRAVFLSLDRALAEAELLIATGTDETVARVAGLAAGAGITAENTLLRGSGFAAAIVEGGESDAQWMGLAEDCLLHEGRGCRNVSVVWAPEGLAVDRFLDAAATFRGVFPGHPSTAAALRLPRAMLEAVGVPCAWADDDSFLVSKGPPETREAGHIRWVSYARDSESIDWIMTRGRAVQVVATDSQRCRSQLDKVVDVTALGSTQRPPLSWKPDGFDTIDFLVSR